MNVYIGSDHGGFAEKQALKAALEGEGLSVTDCGPAALDPADDYPPYAEAVGRAVLADPGSRGILLCRSGEGMAMAANKLPGIRAALAWDPEVARESRQDNDPNVLVLPSDFVGALAALAITRQFLATPFSGEKRHARRIAEITALEAL